MNAAVLVFAKAPQPGRVKTRLSPPLSPAAAADLQLACLQDLWARLGRLTGVQRVLCFDPPGAEDRFCVWLGAETSVLPQADGSLGQRLTAAFAAQFANGLTPLIALGADSPDLPLTHLTLALEALKQEESDVVIGPAADGGYVLIGLSRPQPTLFDEIPWSSSEVTACTLDRCHQAGLRVTLLPAWYDVDRPADLHRLRIQVLNHPTEFSRLARFFCTAALAANLPVGRRPGGSPASSTGQQ